MLTMHKLSLESPDLALMAYEPGAYAFYRWADVAVNVWSSHPTGEAVRTLARLTEASTHENRAGLSSIHWIEEGAGLPSLEARQELGDIVRRYEPHIICVGVLLRGSGFWASAVRSALTGVAMLSTRRFPLRFFGELAPLCDFVAQEHAGRVPHGPAASHIASLTNEAVHHVATLQDGRSRIAGAP